MILSKKHFDRLIDIANKDRDKAYNAFLRVSEIIQQDSLHRGHVEACSVIADAWMRRMDSQELTDITKGLLGKSVPEEYPKINRLDRKILGLKDDELV